MDVLLLQDITRVGKKNDLLAVGDGFALNHLLPSRLAIVATPTVRKLYAEAIKKRMEEKEQERTMQVDAAAALAGKSVTFTKKATKTGKIYAAISEKAISAALKEQLHLDVHHESITIPSPIKAIGTFEVRIRLGEAEQPLAVTVTAETTPTVK